MQATGEESQGSEDEEESELEEDEGPNDDAAGEYFAAQRNPRRASRLAAGKASISELPGGTDQELSAAVRQLLANPSSLPATMLERFRRKYPEWLSILHSGFSLLLHGCGSKKELLEDFASGLDGPTTPVIVLHGYSASVRIKDLFVFLLTQVLHWPTVPTR